MALELLVVLQLDLEQADHLDGKASRAGDADAGVLIGREHLLDVALGDDVAHRGPSVTSHHDTGGVDDGNDRGAVRRLHRSALRELSKRWEQVRRGDPDEVEEAAAAGLGEMRRQPTVYTRCLSHVILSRVVDGRPGRR